jgi:hypothetical protein
MNRIALSFAVLGLVAATGCAASEPETSLSNAAVTANDPRIALLQTKLADIAAVGAQDIAAATQTVALTKVLSASCTGRTWSEPGIPTVTLGGCTFVFENGAGTTTFTGTVSAYVMLKGQPDPTVPNDPVTGQEVPATADKVVQLPSSMIFSSGAAPRFAQPISLEGDDLADWAKGLEGAFDAIEVGIDECGGPSDFPATDPVLQKCFEWRDKDSDHLSLASFATQGDEAIGFYGMDL